MSSNYYTYSKLEGERPVFYITDPQPHPPSYQDGFRQDTIAIHNGNHYVSWYQNSNNNTPLDLLSFYLSNSTFRPVFDELLSNIRGGGLMSKREPWLPYIDNANNLGQSLQTVMFKACHSERLLGHSIIAIMWNDSGFFRIQNLDTENFRISVDGKKVAHLPDWSHIRQNEITEFAVYPEFDAKTVSEIAEITGSEVESSYNISVVIYRQDDINSTYPVPYWHGGRYSCELPGLIEHYNRSIIKNSMSLGTIIEVPTGTEPETIKMLQQQFSKYQGAEKAGSVAILEKAGQLEQTGISTGVEISENKTVTESAKGNWIDLSTVAKDSVHRNLRFPKSLMGDYDSAGFAKDKVDNDRRQLLPFLIQNQRAFMDSIRKPVMDISGLDTREVYSHEMKERSKLMNSENIKSLTSIINSSEQIMSDDQKAELSEIVFERIKAISNEFV